jgi:hypothetical protein
LAASNADGWTPVLSSTCSETLFKEADPVARGVSGQDYFRENDPYGHPVTASFSGGFGEYREELYKRI